MKRDLLKLTYEELLLLKEEVEDRLHENPLDFRANSEYNIYLKLLERYKGNNS